MDFFAQQQHARTLTRRLIGLFVLAVAAIVAAVDALVLLVLGMRGHLYRSAGSPGMHHMPLVVASLVVLGGILLASLYRMLSLAGGGRSVAEAVGATRMPMDTHDPQLSRLRNVVEEMAIAAGIPVPAVYVMADESVINAFAAGFAHGDAVICVTQGCLDQLERDELQGVVAHEFSHVLNGDMRLSIWVMGLLFGIHALAVLGEWMSPADEARGWRDGRLGLSVASIIGVALLVIGSVGYFFGQLIQAAVARSRESLADASAVQFTRQASGLAGALKKTATYGSRLGIGNRRELAHMLFNPSESLHPLLATHPPLIERIRELEPGFSEMAFEKLELAADQSGADASEADPNALRREQLSAESTWIASQSSALPASLGEDTSAAVFSRRPLSTDSGPRRIPETLQQAVRQPESAIAVALALARSEDPAALQQQHRTIAMAFGDDLASAVDALGGAVRALPAALRMPLAMLAAAALTRLSEGRRQTLLNTLDDLLRSGASSDFDNYCAVLLLRARLRGPDRANGTGKLYACRDSFALVSAVIASQGNPDEAKARRAWLLAMQQALPGDISPWKAPPSAWHGPFEHALNQLATLMPAAKELVVRGLLSAVQADGVTSVEESELLHAICATLDCPMPERASD